MEVPTKLLIVDDDEMLLRITVRALEKAEFEIDTASTCAECVAAMEQIRPDILILDVELPDGNGIELCRQLKSDPGFLAHSSSCSLLDGRSPKARQLVSRAALKGIL